jgi:hypothetical protein
MDMSPLSMFWKKSLNNGLLSTYLNDFMKVVELVVTQIMGFVKDKRTFSTLIFMKKRFQNKLSKNLVFMEMFAQTFLHSCTMALPSQLGLMRKRRGVFWLELRQFQTMTCLK